MSFNLLDWSIGAMEFWSDGFKGIKKQFFPLLLPTTPVLLPR